MRIGALHPRAFKYFGHAMDDIRKLFDFHPKIKTEVEEYGNKLFGSDRSHKMCVHIRRGDFVTHPTLRETTSEFLVPAMAVVREFLSKKYSTQNISLIFFTDDEKFVDSLKYPKENYFKIYRPKLPSRGAIIHFGARYCDSFLMSTSSSTFAAWIALLIPEGKNIFYNRRASRKTTKYIGHNYTDYKFPAYWNALEFEDSNNTVFIIK